MGRYLMHFKRVRELLYTSIRLTSVDGFGVYEVKCQMN